MPGSEPDSRFLPYLRTLLQSEGACRMLMWVGMSRVGGASQPAPVLIRLGGIGVELEPGHAIFR